MSETSTCLICDCVAQIQTGTNPWFVAELETGYVVLGDHQFFRGYRLLLGRSHLAELHDLPRPERLRFLEEMSDVAEAVFRWVQSRFSSAPRPATRASSSGSAMFRRCQGMSAGSSGGA